MPKITANLVLRFIDDKVTDKHKVTDNNALCQVHSSFIDCEMLEK